MYLLSKEDGSGLVSLERLSGRPDLAVSTDLQAGGLRAPITYHLENWMKVGGYKSVKGWIEGDASILQSLVLAAEVHLITKSGKAMQIEVTDVTGNRANIRLPRFTFG